LADRESPIKTYIPALGVTEVLGRQTIVKRYLNLYSTGARISGKEGVIPSFPILAFPIMLIVTELGFLAMQS
jgi:hypothetical protein